MYKSDNDILLFRSNFKFIWCQSQIVYQEHSEIWSEMADAFHKMTYKSQ